MSNDGSGYRPSVGERRAQDFAAKKLGDVLNGHGTTVPVDWDRLGNTAAFDVVGGDSNRVDAPVDGDPTLEGEMHTVLRKMVALRQYYLWYAPNASGADLDNLIQQGVDAAAAVLHSYPPFVEKE